MADEKLDYSDPSLLLSEVNKAIATVMVGGQSYKIGSRSLTRANLTELRRPCRTGRGTGQHGLFPQYLCSIF